MARPIDAGVLGKALSEWCSREFEYFKATYGATPKVVSDTLRKVINMIADQPVLDYAPVVHGEWIDEIEPNAVTASGREVHIFKCSACDFTWANKTAVLHYFRYCPNCGANMMDGGKKDGCL